jgi:hypothetical protein
MLFMKKRILFVCCLVIGQAFGATTSDSPICEVGDYVNVSATITNTTKPFLDLFPTKKKRIDTYADQDKDYKVAGIKYTSTQTTPTSIKYSFRNQRIVPGECLYLEIPKHLRDKPVLFVNLGHTQSSADNTGYNSSTKWDDNPGLTSVQLNKSNSDGKSQWRYWNGPSSGAYGAKYAEPTHMELEGLYEWYKYGHKDIKTNTNSREPLYTDGARVCSTGKDPITLGSLVVKMAPSRSKEYKEYNISASNTMGDPLTAKNRSYGSRSDAVFLGNHTSKKINNDIELKNGRLEVKLKVGAVLNSFEASVGDRKANGDSGGSRLITYIQKPDGSKISIIKKENIPPAGVLVGSPEKVNYKVQKGDKLIIESYWDEAFVMGLRVGYN